MQATFTDESTAIDQAIAERIGAQKHRIWFRNSTHLTVADNYLKIGVPNHFIGSWIENHFLEDIAAAVRAVTGTDKKITFNIEPELSGALKRPQLDSQALHVEKAHNKTTRSRIRPADAAPRMEPLKLSLDNFVVGPKNQLAYNAARAVVDAEQSPFNPLFFHGGYGVGKTHLLQGICNAVCASRPKARWLYVSAEDFANQYVLALKTRKLDAFRRRFRQTDLLAIDDIHFLASKKAMQEEFLHTFNTIDLAGKQVVLASDAHPKMIGSLCESLVNRFVSGMVVKIEPPDFETRCKICAQRAASMNQDVPRAVIEYIAERMATNVRELEGALIKLIAYARCEGAHHAGDGSRGAGGPHQPHGPDRAPVRHRVGGEHVLRRDDRRRAFVQEGPHGESGAVVQHVPGAQVHQDVLPGDRQGDGQQESCNRHPGQPQGGRPDQPQRRG